MKERGLNNVLLASSLLFLIPLLIVPIFYSLSVSLQSKAALGRESGWVGPENYISILGNQEFWTSLVFGAVWSSVTVAIQFIVGTGIALALNQQFKGRAFARAFLFLPYVIPTTVAAGLWKWLLHENYGLLNYYVQMFGIKVSSWWNIEYAPLSLTLVAVWEFFPFVTLCVLAGLQSIPQELYEAAKVDGASAVRRFIHVTLPGLRSVLFVALLLRIIWMFNKFDLPWVLTKGGPIIATQNLPIFAYRLTFQNFNMGMGTAASNIIMLILIVMTLVYFRVYRV